MDEILRQARSNWVSVLFYAAYHMDDPDFVMMDIAEDAMVAEIWEHHPTPAYEDHIPQHLRGETTALHFGNINPQIESQSRTIHWN